MFPWSRLERINLERARLNEEQLDAMLRSLRDHQGQLALTSLSLQGSQGAPQLFSALDSHLLREGFTYNSIITPLLITLSKSLKTSSNSTGEQ